MNYPRAYRRINEGVRSDREEIIKEYVHKLQWRLDGRDTLLDIGTGTGDVLMDFIYTIMPPKFDRIVGTDISPKMIDYTKDFYKSYEKCDFKVLDIGIETDLPGDLKQQFDHVTSFYCLQWIKNKRQAMRNIFNLLRAEGGDCFLVILASHPMFDIYKTLSNSNKWSSYMADVDRFIDHLYYTNSENLDFQYRHILNEVGFSDIQVEVRDKVWTYEGSEKFQDFCKAIIPFLDRIPLSLHDSYINDVITIADNFKLKQKHPSNESDYVIKFPYKLIVAYAKKNSNNNRG